MTEPTEVRERREREGCGNCGHPWRDHMAGGYEGYWRAHDHTES